MKVDILLATCNGADYIEQQIMSICSQTYTDWRLLIRDDLSKDITVQKIKSFIEMDPRITLLQDNSGNLGISSNFSKLLSLSTAPLVMFCDQDDVWFPEKIQSFVDSFLALSSAERGSPVLLHSDALLTDKNLITKNKTFLKSRGQKSGLNYMIFTGFVQGSSMMINSHLKDLVNPLPDGVMYDYYIALTCEAIGIRKLINKPLMYYRIHDSNAIGKTDSSLKVYFQKILKNKFQICTDIEMVTLNIFCVNLNDHLTKTQKKLIRICNEIINHPKISHILSVYRYSFNSNGSHLALSLKIILKRIF